jgi:hypothetical protein
MSEIFYNVTVNVSEDVHDDWIEWLQSKHIPAVLRTGMFMRATLLRVHAFEQGGLTYAIQYVCPDMAHYERYLRDFAPALRAETGLRYGDKVQAFRTMLEVVQTFSVEA